MARPLIVCGFGRSGTRMCANVLANSTAVELQGELPVEIAGATMDWLLAAKSARPAPDADRDYLLARDAFRNAAKARPVSRPAALWFGHKSPLFEREFEPTEAVFDDPARRPAWVYCLRHPQAVWRSHRVMPWSGFRDVGAFLKSWTRSVEQFEAMRRAAPDRVILFDLDAMIAAPDRDAWLTETLLAPLGLDPATFRRPLAELQNSNSAAAKLGAPPPEAPARDRDRIARDRAARRIVGEYFAAG